jgi:hypothetical protein
VLVWTAVGELGTREFGRDVCTGLDFVVKQGNLEPAPGVFRIAPET